MNDPKLEEQDFNAFLAKPPAPLAPIVQLYLRSVQAVKEQEARVAQMEYVQRRAETAAKASREVFIQADAQRAALEAAARQSAISWKRGPASHPRTPPSGREGIEGSPPVPSTEKP